MNWLLIIKLLLQLAVQFARRAERADIEKALTDAISLSHKERVDRARDAYDDVASGRVRIDAGSDPNRRD